MAVPEEVKFEEGDKIEQVKDKEVVTFGITLDDKSEEELHEEEQNKKRHLNVILIGHVDAGKSTAGGHILLLSGQVDERTIRKYEKEAMDNGRDSWYMAYIMDTDSEEREKGKTKEVGRAHFETENKRFTLLDAPGHKHYVSNMISAASEADVGVLVISARKGEFESGYEGGGQTREHVLLAKTFGVSKLIIVVNKMDDPTVEWSQERYTEVKSKMTSFLRSAGYNAKKDVQFLPISALLGSNMKTRMHESECPWWQGPSLFEVLDALKISQKDPNGSVRMPIVGKFRELGTNVLGKIESGSIGEEDTLLIVPNQAQVKVLEVYCDEQKVKRAGPGENVRVKLSGVEEADILAGFVLSSVENPITAVTEFIARLQILELPDKTILAAPYKAVLHAHSAVGVDCEIVELVHQIDPKTRQPITEKTPFVKNGDVVVCRIQVINLMCIEKFSDFPQLGRFTLRTEGKTIAFGKVINI